MFIYLTRYRLQCKVMKTRMCGWEEGCAKSDLSGLISLTTVQTQADRGRKRKGKLGGLCFFISFSFLFKLPKPLWRKSSWTLLCCIYFFIFLRVCVGSCITHTAGTQVSFISIVAGTHLPFGKTEITKSKCLYRI